MASYFDHFMVTKILTSYITDSLVMMFCVLMMYMVLSKKWFLIPNSFQSLLEIIFEHWETVVKENLGDNTNFYLLPLVSLFLFILGMNLLGFFTYTFPTTTHIFMTFGMAFSMWMGVMILGLKKFKSSFFSIFMPGGAPLGMSPLLVLMEIASNVSSPVALGMSLAANLTAGHMLMAILADFGSKMLFFSFSITNLFPMLIMIFMTILEIGVLVIQAYVFCLLSMIYLSDSLILH